MSDRVLKYSGHTPLATLRRVVVARLPAWIRQREAAGLEQHQWCARRADHLVPAERWDGTASGGWPPGRRGSGRLRAWLRAVWRRRRSRRQITLLNAHLLRDIGVSYAEAEAEANKPFWRA